MCRSERLVLLRVTPTSRRPPQGPSGSFARVALAMTAFPSLDLLSRLLDRRLCSRAGLDCVHRRAHPAVTPRPSCLSARVSRAPSPMASPRRTQASRARRAEADLLGICGLFFRRSSVDPAPALWSVPRWLALLEGSRSPRRRASASPPVCLSSRSREVQKDGGTLCRLPSRHWRDDLEGFPSTSLVSPPFPFARQAISAA